MYVCMNMNNELSVGLVVRVEIWMSLRIQSIKAKFDLSVIYLYFQFRYHQLELLVLLSIPIIILLDIDICWMDKFIYVGTMI